VGDREVTTIPIKGIAQTFSGELASCRNKLRGKSVELSLITGITGANSAVPAGSLIDSRGSPRATVDVDFYTVHLRFETLTHKRFLTSQ
jgi:hypothetical protein